MENRANEENNDGNKNENIEEKISIKEDKTNENDNESYNKIVLQPEATIFHYEPDCELSKLVINFVVTNYSGEMLNGLFHGFGKASIVGGHVYDGEFKEGFMHGKGTYTWIDGLSYQGDFVCNTMTGKGKFVWSNGSYYEGDVVNSVKHGYGIFRSCRGIKYEGEWYNGEQHGKGLMEFDENGSSYYRGNWWRNKKCGWGTRRYKSGDLYEGEWKDNLRHGNGTMHWIAKGQKYSGQWQNGHQDGEGEHVWYIKRSSTSQYFLRNTYKGCMKRGVRHGWGVFSFANGTRYEGEWCDNLKTGKGKLVFRSGRFYEGTFLNDQIVEYPDFKIENCSSPDLTNIRTRTPQPFEATGFDSVLGFKLNLDHLMEDILEKENEYKQAVNVVLKYSTYLRKIYKVYSRAGTELGESVDNVYALSQMQFWRLMKDCELQNYKKFELPDYDEIIAKTETEKLCGFDPLRVILYEDFVSYLIEISYHLFHSDMRCSPVFAMCFTKLLTEHILKHACHIKGYFFHSAEKSHEILKQVQNLYESFQSLCYFINKKDHTPGQNTISMRQFLLLLNDLHLINDTLTAADVISVLSSDCKSVSSDSHIYLDYKMGFYDFVEAVVGCSLVKSYPLCFCCLDPSCFGNCSNTNPEEKTSLEKMDMERTSTSRKTSNEIKSGDISGIKEEEKDGTESKVSEKIQKDQVSNIVFIGNLEEDFPIRLQRFLNQDFSASVKKYIESFNLL